MVDFKTVWMWGNHRTPTQVKIRLVNFADGTASWRFVDNQERVPTIPVIGHNAFFTKEQLIQSWIDFLDDEIEDLQNERDDMLRLLGRDEDVE